jgi:serine kinase of HPr protein (carbohydrate metabolism regulator)
MIRHAGLVATRLGGRWRGALIEGPSGTGKSDLAIRMMGGGFRLVADDRVEVWTSGGRLFGKAPAPLLGLLEARGVGIIPEAPLDFCEIVLLVQCKPEAAEVERMPDPAAAKVLGVYLPRIELWPFEAAGPAKLRRALEHLGGGAFRAYLGGPRGASPTA